jgi:hypothetical protein
MGYLSDGTIMAFNYRVNHVDLWAHTVSVDDPSLHSHVANGHIRQLGNARYTFFIRSQDANGQYVHTGIRMDRNALGTPDHVWNTGPQDEAEDWIWGLEEVESDENYICGKVGTTGFVIYFYQLNGVDLTELPSNMIKTSESKKKDFQMEGCYVDGTDFYIALRRYETDYYLWKYDAADL